MLTLEVLNLSIHSFKNVPHASVIWTKIVRSKQHLILSFFWQNNGIFKNHFWQSVDAILKDVSVPETIV